MADKKPPRPRMARWARLALASAFLIVGLIGLALPLVPQIPFFMIAALLFAPDFPPARRLVSWAFRKWPRLRKAIPRKYRDLGKKEPAKEAAG